MKKLNENILHAMMYLFEINWIIYFPVLQWPPTTTTYWLQFNILI